MKRLHFQKPNDLSRLHDELLRVLPALRPTGGPADAPSLERSRAAAAVIAVEGKGDDIWLTVPDDADDAAIASVVAAHDNTQPGLNPRRDRRNRIDELVEIPRSSWTSAQMRELIYLIAQEQQ